MTRITRTTSQISLRRTSLRLVNRKRWKKRLSKRYNSLWQGGFFKPKGKVHPVYGVLCKFQQVSQYGKLKDRVNKRVGKLYWITDTRIAKLLRIGDY